MGYWRAKRVMVTGGGGFIGRHVVAALQNRGCLDVAVVRSREYDLTRETDVIRAFQDIRPQIVIHLAGRVGSIVSNRDRPAEFFYQNLMMGTFVLHYAHVFGAEKCVATMSGAGYPVHAPVPFKETALWDGLPQPETAPYSLAKRVLHIQAEAYFQQYGFVSIVAIPGNAYGPFDNFDLTEGRVIAALVRKFVEAAEERQPKVLLWGTGEATRDFIYGEDLAHGLLLAAERYDHPVLINISSGAETRIRDVAEILREVTGFRGQVIWDTSRPDGQVRRWFDISKARHDLGFEPRFAIDDGLRRTVAWFRQQQAAARLS